MKFCNRNVFVQVLLAELCLYMWVYVSYYYGTLETSVIAACEVEPL